MRGRTVVGRRRDFAPVNFKQISLVHRSFPRRPTHSDLMVRRRPCAVSNHEATGLILRDAREERAPPAITAKPLRRDEGNHLSPRPQQAPLSLPQSRFFSLSRLSCSFLPFA